MAFIIQYLGVYCGLEHIYYHVKLWVRHYALYIFVFFTNSKPNIPFSYIVVYHLLFSFLLFNFHIHIHSPWYNIISLLIITIFRITHHIAFVSASRAATIPVSISSALSSGHVTETIARFDIPLGATASRYSLLLFMYYVVLYLHSIRLIWMVRGNIFPMCMYLVISI